MNVLIIGLGSIARKHIVALDSIIGEFIIYALRSSPNEKTEAGIININNLDNPAIKFDFAIVSNPTHLHYMTIDRLIDLSIPLFIEKPVVGSLDNIDKLLHKIKLGKIKTYVACNLRFHPCIDFLKRNLSRIDINNINEVNVYCGSYLPDWRPGVNYKEVYSANEDMGGGVHLDLFHELDYSVYLFGFPLQSSKTLRSDSSLEISAIDYANYLLNYNSFSLNIILNYYRRKSKRTIDIVFKHSSWIVDLIAAEIRDDSSEIIYKTDFNMAETYKKQMEYFLEFLNSKDSSINSIEESIEILKICLKND